jgi:hypothetical protein
MEPLTDADARPPLGHRPRREAVYTVTRELDEPLTREISRRHVLQGTGVALAALVPAAVVEACSSGGRSPQSRPSASHSSGARRDVFDQHQTELISEATAGLIPGPNDDPAEAGHPGAREANVTRYITTLIGALLVSPPTVFAGGPFSGRAGGGRDDMADFLALDSDRSATWRTRLAGLKLAYDQGLSALDREAGARGFLGLDAAGRDRVLATNAKVPDLPDGYTGFTDLLFAHAIEGMYSAPEYGGNAGLVGWHDIGFPGDVQPRGFPAATVSSPLSREVLKPSAAVVKVLNLVSAVSPAPVRAP